MPASECHEMMSKVSPRPRRPRWSRAGAMLEPLVEELRSAQPVSCPCPGPRCRVSRAAQVVWQFGTAAQVSNMHRSR
jgi:hypothetical protein